MTAEELGELYDEKRRAWEEATGAEGFGDDYAIEVARRLDGLQFDPPEYIHGTQGRTACGRCGAEIASEDLHSRWHELASAGIKLATYEANLGHLGAAFLGIALRELFGEEVLTGTPAEPAEPQWWTPSGHGHLYPLPNGSRARCGGPGMCAKCKADLEHSERVGDGAADRWRNTIGEHGDVLDRPPFGDRRTAAIVADRATEIVLMLEPLDQEIRGRILASVLRDLGLQHLLA